MKHLSSLQISRLLLRLVNQLKIINKDLKQPKQFFWQMTNLRHKTMDNKIFKWVIKMEMCKSITIMVRSTTHTPQIIPMAVMFNKMCKQMETTKSTLNSMFKISRRPRQIIKMFSPMYNRMFNLMYKAINKATYNQTSRESTKLTTSLVDNKGTEMYR